MQPEHTDSGSASNSCSAHYSGQVFFEIFIPKSGVNSNVVEWGLCWQAFQPSEMQYCMNEVTIVNVT